MDRRAVAAHDVGFPRTLRREGLEPGGVLLRKLLQHHVERCRAIVLAPDALGVDDAGNLDDRGDVFQLDLRTLGIPEPGDELHLGRARVGFVGVVAREAGFDDQLLGARVKRDLERRRMRFPVDLDPVLTVALLSQHCILGGVGGIDVVGAFGGEVVAQVAVVAFVIVFVGRFERWLVRISAGTGNDRQHGLAQREEPVEGLLRGPVRREIVFALRSSCGRPAVLDDLGLQRDDLAAGRVDLERHEHRVVVEVGDVERAGDEHARVLFGVVDVPVDVVGEAVELERQLVVVVALGVVVRLHVLAQHEAVGDLAAADPIGVDRTVVGLHLDVAAVGLVVLVSGVALLLVARGVELVVVVAVLPLVLALALHVLVEEERFGLFGVGGRLVLGLPGRVVLLAGGVGVDGVSLGDAGVPVLSVVGPGAVDDLLALGDELSLLVGRVLVAQLAGAGDILDGDRFEVDEDSLLERRAVVGHRHLRGGAADPGVERRGLGVEAQQRGLLLDLAGRREEAQHLVVGGDVALVPREEDRLQTFDRADLVGTIVEPAHVGHGVDVVVAVGDAFAQREGRARGLRLGRGAVGRGGALLLLDLVPAGAFALGEGVFLHQIALAVIEQHAEAPDAADRVARRAGRPVERRHEGPELHRRGDGALSVEGLLPDGRIVRAAGQTDRRCAEDCQ